MQENPTGDLHCHTTFSDGSETPEDIAAYADRYGLSCVAVTDHDAFDGAARAKAAGSRAKVIAGVELSTFDYKNGRKVHLLCYEPRKDAELREIAARTQRSREEASLRIIEKLRAKYPLDVAFVRRFQKDSPVLFKHHIILALMHLGYTCSIFGGLYRELFGRPNGWAMVEPTYPEIREVLPAALASGGVCVLAHPGVYGNFELLPELAAMGLHGVETWHPRQSEADCERARAAAGELQLLKTGGTDFHGAFSSRPFPFASRVTPAEELQKLFKISGSPFFSCP